MQELTIRIITDDDVKRLLAAVGVDRDVSAEDYARPFGELEIDSLARMEVAARIQEDFGVDVEADLTEEQTLAGMKELVNRQLAA